MTVERISTGITLGVAGGNTGYYLLSWMDKITPSQWSGIGVVGSLSIAAISCLISFYYHRKKELREAAAAAATVQRE